jgi:hydrogenase maturation protease
MKQTLLIGLGNSARQDDGLGWAFAHEVEQLYPHEEEVTYKFQLNLEDAELISEYGKIIFVDAFKGELEKGFSVYRCYAKSDSGFSTHMVSPEAILYLCQQLYHSEPEATVLAIQGYQWELQEGLTAQATLNLQKAWVWYTHKAHELSL